MRRFFLILLGMAIYSMNGFAQKADSALFDFWVGEWDLSWKDATGKMLTGENTISWKWNKSVLVEDFRASDGSLLGGSQSVFNAKSGLWQQTWTDSQGGYIHLTGSMDGEKRFFSTVPKKVGKETVVMRMVFSDITRDAFTWDWQRSGNNGKTWTSQWKIDYKRKRLVDVESIAVLKLTPEEKSGKGSLKDLAFLEGFWQGPGLGGDCDELWLPATDSSMAGLFRFSAEGKIVFSEFMVLEQVGETLQLRLKHFGRDLTPWEEKEQWTTFRFIKREGQTAYFHGLTYHRSGNELIVRLSLKQKGEYRIETFSFKKGELD